MKATPVLANIGMSLCLGVVACGGNSTSQGTSFSNDDASVLAAADFSCLPDCYRQAFETCQPMGTCVLAVVPGSGEQHGEGWMCFSNGVDTHTISSAQSGTYSIVTDIRQGGTPCRRLESTEGTAGLFYTIKDGTGQVLATATIKSYPGITVACGATEQTFDRTTRCGQAAALEIANIVGTTLLHSCSIGACSTP